MRVISSIELGIKTFFGFLITMRLAHNPGWGGNRLMVVRLPFSKSAYATT